MKKVLWVTPGFAENEADSRCIPPMQLLARQLQLSGKVSVRIVALHYPYKSEPYLWHDIPVHPCYRQGIGQGLRIRGAALSRVGSICKKDGIDVIHSFWLTDAALIGHWISRLYKTPHLVTLMGQDAKIENRYLKLLPAGKMNTITLSGFHDAVLKKSTGSGADRVVPWGIDRVDLPEPYTSRDIDILGVGNLIPLKRYETFIRLVAKAKKRKPDIRAVLIGDGEERIKLEKLANELDLKQHLQFKGYVARGEVMRYMSRSKTLLHPSVYESFGFVFLEALACGMNIVSSPVGIAAASDKWFLGKDETALEQALFKALSGFKATGPEFPYPVSETLAAYLDVYNAI